MNLERTTYVAERKLIEEIGKIVQGGTAAPEAGNLRGAVVPALDANLLHGSRFLTGTGDSWRSPGGASQGSHGRLPALLR